MPLRAPVPGLTPRTRSEPSPATLSLPSLPAARPALSPSAPFPCLPPALAGGLWAGAPSFWKVGQGGRRRRQGTASVPSAHISLTVIPQGGGYPESTQSQGPRLVKLQPPALQAPSTVCPGGGPDPIAQPQPEALLPSPSSCDTGLLHSRLFPPSVATLLPWVPVIFVLTFPFFFGS